MAALWVLAQTVSAKMPTAVWHVAVAGQDSLFCEGLARDLSQALAEDTSLKVFDARRRGGDLLDSLYAKSPTPKVERLREALPPKIEIALAVDCRPLENSLACRVEGRFLGDADRSVIDTGHYALESLVQRRLFGACLVRRWREHWRESRIAWPAKSLLVLKRPAIPARLLRDLEILQEGAVSQMMPGTLLETGDLGGPVVASREGVHYVLYPAGSYAYPMPNALQLLRGTLGLWHRQDTNTIASRLWQTLSAANGLDAQDTVTRQLRALAATGDADSLYRALVRLAAQDSGQALRQSLARVAALDTGNLIWRGLAQADSQDSSHALWRKLGLTAGLDSSQLRQQIGLLALPDSSVLLTPSCVLRGQPEILVVRHQGSETVIELVQGNLSATPLLSSQGAQRLSALQRGVTRGFALELSRLPENRAEKISTDLAAAAEPKSGTSLAQLLPGRLFSHGGVRPTLARDMQDFIANELSSVDVYPDRLGPLPWDAAGAFTPMPSGKNEAGCYLCLPNRLGP